MTQKKRKEKKKKRKEMERKEKKRKEKKRKEKKERKGKKRKEKKRKEKRKEDYYLLYWILYKHQGLDHVSVYLIHVSNLCIYFGLKFKNN